MSRFTKHILVALFALLMILATMPTRALSAQIKSWSRDSNGNYVNNKGEVIVGALRRGVDVSEWNGTIDWEKAKADDISFAIIRVGGRYMSSRSFYFDSQFERNVAECERLGIPYGVYFFTTAKTVSEAREEALFTINHLKGHNPTMPIYFDMEWDELASTSNRQLFANMATAFCETIAAAGYEPGVYASASWWINLLTDPCFDRWSKWVAQYYYKCEYEGTYDMWQCSSTATVAGFSNGVDLNMDFRAGWGMKGTWVQADGGWKYRFEDGSYASGDLVYIDGLVYSFDSRDIMRTGWQSISDAWYYFDPTSGAMQRGWLYLDGSYYYLDPASGRVTVDWAVVNGTYYCFDSNGKLILNGYAYYGGKTYYMDKYGHVTKNAWHHDTATDTYYYFGSDGAAYANRWFDYGGIRYRFGSDGKLIVSDWAQVSGEYYYLGANGGLVQNSFVSTNGKLYYVDESAHPVKGWHKLAGDGAAEAWYYFGSDYAAYTNRWMSYNGTYYYFGASSELVINGWAQYNGSWYYLGENGTVTTDAWVRGADGGMYYLGSDGRVKLDSWVQTDGAWYYVGSTGRRVIANWIHYNGSWYYLNVNGNPLVNTSIDYNGTRYHFGSDGICTGYEKLA